MLHKIPVDRKLIEELHLNAKISDEARQYSLDILYPRNEWLLWLSRLLMFIGSTLILSGIIYFFSFNWDQIASVAKLLIVESMIAATIVCAYIFSLCLFTCSLIDLLFFNLFTCSLCFFLNLFTCSLI